MRTATWVAGLLVVLSRSAAGQKKLLTDWGTFMFERDLGLMSGVVSGPADSVYRVQVTPATKGAKLQLLVHAEAVDVPGGRNERAPCTRTGRLEFEVLTHLRQVFPGT